MSANAANPKLEAVLAGPANFAQAMLAVSIHVGMGRNPVCVTCGEPWPCSTERFDAAVDWTARMLGVHPTDAALILSMVGLDHERDELGYQRVCQQSGVLPL